MKKSLLEMLQSLCSQWVWNHEAAHKVPTSPSPPRPPPPPPTKSKLPEPTYRIPMPTRKVCPFLVCQRYLTKTDYETYFGGCVEKKCMAYIGENTCAITVSLSGRSGIDKEGERKKNDKGRI